MVAAPGYANVCLSLSPENEGEYQRHEDVFMRENRPAWMSRQRIRFTIHQTARLEEFYKGNPYPSLAVRKDIATEFGLPEKSIRVRKINVAMLLFAEMIVFYGWSFCVRNTCVGF